MLFKTYFRRFLFSVTVIWAGVISGQTPVTVFQSGTVSGKTPIDEIPMYDFSEKSKKSLKADERFLDRCDKTYLNRNVASEAYVNLGWISTKSDISNALKRFNQAWLLDSSNCNIYYGFAACMKLRRDTILSNKYIRMGMNRDSGQIGLKKYINTLDGFFQFIEYPDEMVIGFYKELYSYDTNSSYPLAKLGFYYGNLNDSSNSFKYNNKAVLKDSQDVISLTNRGTDYLKYKQYDKALVDFNRAILISPEYIWAYDNRAQVYIEIDQVDLAIDDLLKVIELCDEKVHGTYYGTIGDLLIRNGDKTEGCEYLLKSYDYGFYVSSDKKEIKKVYKENCK